MTTFSFHWAVAIFASRESADTLVRSVQAAVIACGTAHSNVDILVNGNTALAEQMHDLLGALGKVPVTCRIRLWSILFGDKAHAWNQFMHQISCESELTFFVDGYVQVRPDSFSSIAAGLKMNPNAIAATGVPTVGRTATALRQQMIEGGGLHGNLYAVRSSTMEMLKNRKVTLPLGLYRNDGLLGAMFNYNLNPAEYDWNPKRILVQPESSWDLQEQQKTLLKTAKGKFDRLLRQNQGILENLAVREHFSLNKLRPERLPLRNDMLINSWVARHAKHANFIFLRHPLTRYAFHRLQKPRDWTGVDVLPFQVMKNDIAIGPISIS